MPEIGEVARIVSRLRTHLVGRTISKVTGVEDAIVYKDTTYGVLKKALEGKKVLAAKQWGKYFWLVMESPPHPLMHFGMTGWIFIKNDPTAHYRSGEIQKDWEPNHLKFNLHLHGTENEIAFTDPRRLGRIRLIDHEDGNDLRKITPMKENGPDPVQEPIEIQWLTEKLRKRKVSIKALLLDQNVIAGIGNWVGDEILWNAKIHPEAHSNTLTDAQITELHRAILYVTKFAVDVEADSSKFPQDWLMLHRWGKGKTGNQLPTGEKIEFIKVGGRASAYVPSVQKKGPGVEAQHGERESQVENVKTKKAGGREGREKKEPVKENEENEVENVKLKKTSGRKRGAVEQIVQGSESEFEEKKPRAKGRGRTKGKKAVKEDIEEEKLVGEEDMKLVKRREAEGEERPRSGKRSSARPPSGRPKRAKSGQ